MHWYTKSLTFNPLMHKITLQIIILLLSFSQLSFSQRFVEPENMKSFNVTVNFNDYTVKTQMLKDHKKIDVNPDLTYSWYTSQKIIETKGGFDGKLIHGYYKAFYLNNQLKESGDFKYGVKNGEWKIWYTDGKLKEITNWRNGVKTGKFTLYNDYGVIMASGSFKNNLLHGKFYTYDNKGNILLKQKYNAGVEIIKVEKKKKEKVTKTKEAPKEKTEKKLKKKTEVSINNDNTDSQTKPSKEKKSFGQKIKSLFKKKPKQEKEATSNTQSLKP